MRATLIHIKAIVIPDAKKNIPVLLLFLFLCFASCGGAPDEIGPASGYGAAVEKLGQAIQAEINQKGIPSLSIAIADDQQIIWAKAFGMADPENNIPANTGTFYRIASVSKLFTDIAVMQLAERGEIDIDAPVMQYIPQFSPENPFKKEITLRQLMSHRSGLVREPPVGNYYDPSEPSLRETILSLNATKLIFKPETRTKYSNVAIGVTGYVIECLKEEDFAEYMQREILDPLNMKSSSFLRNAEIEGKLAKAKMWRYDGKEFAAPLFEFGFLPAANIYTTMPELAQCMIMLMNGGGEILRPETLEQMWTPQFTDEKDGYGIGFYTGRFDGHHIVRHGGAVYGFATDFSVLPDAKIGVCASASCDVSNAVVSRITEYALRLMLAVREESPLPEYELTTPVDPETAKKLDGRYRNAAMEVELHERNGRLFLEIDRMMFEVRVLGDALIVDDRHNFGQRILPQNGGIEIENNFLRRVDRQKPSPAPAQWKTLIGEYGNDFSILYIYEKSGRMHALIEWVEIDPLTEIEQDVFTFPDFGMFPGEKLVFHRDDKGNVTEAVLEGVTFKRRAVGTEEGETFTITPVRPVEELREEALAATLPEFEGDFLESDLVEVARLDPSIKLDMRYATTNNFMQAVFYSAPKAFLQRPAAEALVRANGRLKKYGYGLMIHDAYRPWYVTKMFWDATPEEYKIFVANPRTGSIHNRGGAVDLTLYDLKTGQPVQMVAGFDEFSDRSFADYPGGTSLQRWLRSLLRKTLEQEGFTVYPWEWWHFNYEDASKYPVMNVTFDKITEKAR